MIKFNLGFIPYNCKSYSLSLYHEKVINNFIDENLRKGYIYKLASCMASPLFFVDKKDGSLCLCQDYQKHAGSPGKAEITVPPAGFDKRKCVCMR